MSEVTSLTYVGAFIWDLRTNVVDLDDGAKVVLGFDQSATVTAADIFALISPSDRTRVESAISLNRPQNVPLVIEYGITRPDGTRRTILSLNQFLSDSAGVAITATGIFQDVTAQRAAARAVSESEQLYRDIFAQVDSGFCIVEVDLHASGDEGQHRIDYRVIDANPAFYQQTGFPEAILGQWLRTAAPGLEEHWFQTYGGVARTGTPARFEQGSEALGRWFNVYAFRVDANENPRVAILFNDITGRRRAELALAELNHELEERIAERTAERNRIWEKSRDLIGIADDQGKWLSVNPAWTAVLGWRQDEIVGRTSEWMEHPEDKAKTRSEISTLSKGNPTFDFENRFRTRDGEYRNLSWTATPEGGRLYCIARDVTNERAQTEALRIAEEQLRQAQKMEAVGQLTGGLAHDFNNLLAGISGALELMGTRISQGRIKDVDKYLVAAQGASRRAAALTHRLLAFSRRQTLDPKPTNVNTLVTGMLDLIQRTVGPSIHVENVGASGLWPALVDPSQLENSLLNLCINARDAMPDGGKITIETANRWIDRQASKLHDLPEGQDLSLCVSDTGTGMSKDVIDKAFDPFFTTKPIGQGTGLGLSMIYGFAKQSGGQVRIYSELGQGTMVCIYLPRHYGSEAGQDEVDERMPISFAEAGETVLIVDDEPTVRMLVADVLEDLGYTALEANDSAAGLKLLQSDQRIDLLVTDVGLPGGMNGRQMADAARVKRSDLKVLFITGYAENALLNNGQLEPGMSVLTKPFAVDILAARIREMLID